MKSTLRALLLCAAVLVLPAAAWAGPWQMGVRTGLSLTNLHGELPDLAGPDYKPGFQGGGFVEYGPGPFAIALELAYVQKGATFKSEQTDNQGNVLGIVEDDLQLSYLEIPVLVRASLPLGGAVEPYAVLGPTFGIALGAEFGDQDLGDDLEPMDFGGTAGLGARFGSGLYRLLVEARYSTSFSDLWDISGNLDSINHGFGLTVGVVR